MRKDYANLERGQAMMIATVFFLIVGMAIVFGIAAPVFEQQEAIRELHLSRQSYFLAEAGIEDAVYRLVTGKNLPSSNTLLIGVGSANVTVTPTQQGKDIVSSASVNGDVRKLTTSVVLGTGISFHYGIQAGQGGFVLQNSSSVTGNVYSGGTVRGSGNYIYGDVVSSGTNGQIYGIHATGSAYAHSIGATGAGNATTIDKNAYYKVITNTTVAGTSYPNSADLGDVSLPITDAQIAAWESDATAGGVATCTNGSYTVNSDVVLGPIKIPCDFNLTGIAGGVNVTVKGPIWVVGNIDLSNRSNIRMDSSLGSANVGIIADNPSNPNGSGIITIGQNTVFYGSGATSSFVFMISQNKSGENGGSTNALTMNNGASALVAYAIHGLITLAQSVGVKEVTAYKIILQNSANVTYDSGLPSVLFESGPSGGYDITKWKETQ